jgi:hypothetical protein
MYFYFLEELKTWILKLNFEHVFVKDYNNF